MQRGLISSRTSVATKVDTTKDMRVTTAISKDIKAIAEETTTRDKSGRVLSPELSRFRSALS